MFRRDLIPLLRERFWAVADLARLLEAEPREIEDDLRHLLRSLKGSEYRVVIETARCRHCGFAFHREKLGKPGRCPHCRGTWIQAARIHLEAR